MHGEKKRGVTYRNQNPLIYITYERDVYTACTVCVITDYSTYALRSHTHTLLYTIVNCLKETLEKKL